MSSIMLGNLTAAQIEKRLGISFPADLVEFMKSRHQYSASNVQPGKWHCFDIPFVLVCGDYDTAKTIYEALAPQSKACRESLQFSIQQ